jgi:tRNA(fMet)-specific endonuclease VapC
VYVLDANACIHLINGTSPGLIARFKAKKPDDFRMSTVVRAELIFGARNSSRIAENLRLLDRFLAPFTSLPFDDAGAEAYGQIRVELKRQGKPIGANDLLIAASALAHNLTLITHNVREFGRVPGLKYEDWEASP